MVVCSSSLFINKPFYFILQGLQGEAGPKGDPGQYGTKGERVRDENQSAFQKMMIRNLEHARTCDQTAIRVLSI